RGTTGPGTTDAQVSRTLQRLVDLRGEAWEGRDPAALTLAMAPDSPALAAEQGQLEAARALGLVYPDVTFRVEEAAVVEQTQGRLTVEATITRAPLRAIDDDGDEQLTSGMQTDQLRIVLAAAKEGWLLWSWGEPGR
ncbi:MAG: hypothetical protein Q4P07_14160, partial [Ornithinimicrobium sp.]|uniref:hypothetical protein n=1 Tax=Ornithinimicrobium sp. TaxID=1977084 RepID=UPI0026E06A0A